ncbi:MAG TPA: tRNA (cytosine(32)/uridine(32)-2'-O)-methyltransferase TrmJ [Gammaproteobacteria bacterium]|nr:tRNA (cytosine(32)/uridine(32)-2'-O)-methyltransferase TrmJ [Gammaproteobacteria bacterium]
MSSSDPLAPKPQTADPGMLSPLQRTRVVLCDTTHTGNMGAAARALKTMGLEKLFFVSPQKKPDDQAVARATSASDLLLAAPVTPTLHQAIGDCNLVFGTSARTRSVRWPVVTPQEAAQMVITQPSETRAAFLFGKEQYGLTNEQMDRCQYLVRIPANPEYGSINLASAVQIICYQLRVSWLASAEQQQKSIIEQPRETDLPANDAEFEAMFIHLTETLAAIEFVDLDNPGRVLRRLRALLQRSMVSKNEAAIIRGICNAAQGRKSRKEQKE